MENVVTNPTAPVAVAGSAGINTQLPGQATTVDGIAAASGGIGAGQLMEVDIDSELFKFDSDDTPLMQLMLGSKRKVKVNSPKVQHFQLDEEKSSFVTASAVTKNTSTTSFVLPVPASDKKLCSICGTLRVRGVAGYDVDGATEKPNTDLMLYIVNRDANTGNPIVVAINGPKSNPTDAECTTPAIPANTTIDILSVAMHETQQKVEPNSVLPVPEIINLQKRGMNQIISDYFDSQVKRIPFAKSVIAEHAIRKFKREGNRTLWASAQGEIQVQDPETGYQTVYFTKGILYQFKRVVEHTGKWNYEEFVSLAKTFFTGVDVPQGAYCLCGKNFLENIQCIDFSKHPEIQIVKDTNPIGWKVTKIQTVFGDFEFKWEPTLDKLGFENSAAIIGQNRLVHYQRTQEHKDTERIVGHEANRESLIVWDALALKGSCHVFVNGDNDKSIGAPDAVNFTLWTEATAPTNAVNGQVFYLVNPCPGINAASEAGELWQATVSEGSTTWVKYQAALI